MKSIIAFKNIGQKGTFKLKLLKQEPKTTDMKQSLYNNNKLKT